MEVEVLDPDLLVESAKRYYRDAWGDDDWEPAGLGEVALEVLVNSNQNPSPDELGIQISNYSVAEKLCGGPAT